LRSALSVSDAAVQRRRVAVANETLRRKAASAELAQSGAASPMSAEWMSHCLSDIMDERAVVFSELGVVPSCMRLRGPNRVFTTPHSGGLGWGFPAALGAQLADRDRLCIACVGDGSYMFANPVACHQIAEALDERFYCEGSHRVGGGGAGCCRSVLQFLRFGWPKYRGQRGHVFTVREE